MTSGAASASDPFDVKLRDPPSRLIGPVKAFAAPSFATGPDAAEANF